MTPRSDRPAADDVPADPRISRREWLLVAVLAVGLCLLFWWRLCTGGGLIGGDIYSYFLPQKQFFAERLRQGEFPLWNNRSGFGYPLIAESQTGAFYPVHLLLFSLLDVNTAYNADQLLHYVLAFMFAWRLGRELKLSASGAILAAVIYVYGWFPPRICLEWAILGGCWLPLAVLWTERFLKSGRWRFAAALALTLTMQLLAGHYNLAFITQLTVIACAALRLFPASGDLFRNSLRSRAASLLMVTGAVAVSLCLAAPQLLPTWELKRSSQREHMDGVEFDPGHGHIPPLYLSQVVASWWFWYDPDVDRDRALKQLDTLAIGSDTNQIEAHLYFGLAPLIVIGLVLASRHRPDLFTRQTCVWLILSTAAVVYATGWLLPVTKYLPGFSFFRGPGRYGIVVTLGVALIAGRALGLLTSSRRRVVPCLVTAVVLVATVWDLKHTADVVKVAEQLRRPVLAGLEHSPVRNLLLNSSAPRPVRLFGPGPNLPNLLGVSSVPEYLGIGPAEYYDPALRAPDLETDPGLFVDWLRRAGVTHLLSFAPVSPAALKAGLRSVYTGPDPFLNPVWARPFDEPLSLYEVPGTRGRVSFLTPLPGQRVSLVDERANRVAMDLETPEPATVVLTDLSYPGWNVYVDNQPSESVRFEGQFRSVTIPTGRHRVEWIYRPKIMYIGTVISGVTGALLLGALWLRRPARTTA